MKKQIFPVEILKYSHETLFVKHYSRTHIIYITLLVLAMVVLGLLPFVEVSVSKQSQGIITSKIPNNEIIAPQSGYVTYADIKENQLVKKGDILCELSTYNQDESLSYLKEKQGNLKNQLNDLNMLLTGNRSGRAFLSQKYLQEWIEFDAFLKELQIKEEFAEREYKVNKQLFEQKAISKNEYKDYEYRYNLTKQNRLSYEEKTRNTWQSNRLQVHQSLAQITTDAKQILIDKEKYTIRSPMNGVLKNVSGIQKGNLLGSNQKIVEISSLDSIKVQCMMSPTDIGLIEEGVSVKFQIDAYNYNLWGLASGTVEEVAKDVVFIEGVPFYQVWCSLDQRELSLSNGFVGKLNKGHTLIARFFVTRRTLYQLLFDLIDDCLNPNTNKS